MLYGVTHTLDGAPIVRLPKSTKVGIGFPKGKAIHVFMARSAKSGKLGWWVETGYGQNAKVTAFERRQDAEAFYNEQLQKVGDCPFPRKIPYFTFSKPSADGSFVHDFDAIERHGEKPTAIDIVFLSNEPLKVGREMWTASELKCSGDGITARRVLSMAQSEDDKAAAALAKEQGERFFTIVNRCSVHGCEYANEGKDKNGKVCPPPCKISTDLEFQLANDIRVGSKAHYHSTGYRTTAYLFSALQTVAALTGGYLFGVPLKLVVKPFKATHNGQSSTQYAVSVEFRADDMQAIKTKLIGQMLEFRRLATAPVDIDPAHDTKLLAGAVEDDDEDMPARAAVMAAEFYPASDDDEPVQDAVTPSSQAAAATERATESLKDRLMAQQQKAAEAPAPAAVPEEPAPAAAPAAEPPKKRRTPFD